MYEIQYYGIFDGENVEALATYNSIIDYIQSKILEEITISETDKDFVQYNFDHNKNHNEEDIPKNLKIQGRFRTDFKTYEEIKNSIVPLAISQAKEYHIVFSLCRHLDFKPCLQLEKYSNSEEKA